VKTANIDMLADIYRKWVG